MRNNTLAESMLETLQPLIAESEVAWVEEIEDCVGAFHQGEMSSYFPKAVFVEAHDTLR